jgi:hypothetical protein
MEMYREDKLKAEIGFETRFFTRAYAAPIDCFVISNEPSYSWMLSEIGVIRLSESWIPVFIECKGLVQNDPVDSGEPIF